MLRPLLIPSQARWQTLPFSTTKVTQARGIFCHFLSCSFPHSYPTASKFLDLRKGFHTRIWFLLISLQPPSSKRWQVSFFVSSSHLSSFLARAEVLLHFSYTNSLLLSRGLDPLHSSQEAQPVGVSFSAAPVALSPFQAAQLVWGFYTARLVSASKPSMWLGVGESSLSSLYCV